MTRTATTRVGALLMSLLTLAGLTGCSTDTVASVEVDRYLGTWYEVASYPAFFNIGLVGTTAEYSLNEDGTVRVVNQGFMGDFDGEVDRIEGIARVLDPETNATLGVDFTGTGLVSYIPSYLIVDLADDYSYSVVTDPLQSTLFILSRTPELDPDVYAGILERLDADGFDLERLVETPQQPAD